MGKPRNATHRPVLGVSTLAPPAHSGTCHREIANAGRKKNRIDKHGAVGGPAGNALPFRYRSGIGRSGLPDQYS
jgi:hypothetical protein